MNTTLLVDFWVSGNTAAEGRTNNVSTTISIILWKDEPLQAEELRAKLSCFCLFLVLFWCLYLYLSRFIIILVFVFVFSLNLVIAFTFVQACVLYLYCKRIVASGSTWTMEEESECEEVEEVVPASGSHLVKTWWSSPWSSTGWSPRSPPRWSARSS